MSHPVSRREMVGLLAAGIAVMGGATPARLAALVPPSGLQGDAELTAWVRAQLGDTDVSSLAAAWKTLHPAESSGPALARAIVNGRKRDEPLAPFLARRVGAEHQEGRAESVDGWFLAPTEARLATLLDVVRSGPR